MLSLLSKSTLLALALALMALAPAVPASAGKGGQGGGKPPKDPPPALTNPALVFAKDGALYLTTADGSVSQQLTDPNVADGQPSWSPTEPGLIGFARRPSADWGCGDFYTVRADGTAEALEHDFFTAHSNTDGATPCLDSDRSWDWSPDGTRIAFASNSGTYAPVVYILDIASGNITALTPDWQPPDGPGGWFPSGGVSWSPDGSKIAYHAWVDNITGDDIFVVDVDTGQITNLTPMLSAQRAPSWSSDGQVIAYWGDDQPRPLMVMNADGTNHHELASFLYSPGPETPTWSPGDSYIAFTQRAATKGNSTTFDLFRIGSDGSSLVNLTSSRWPYEKQPDWNPAWVDDLGN